MSSRCQLHRRARPHRGQGLLPSWRGRASSDQPGLHEGGPDREGAPYGNIVAINRNTAILHYTHLSTQRVPDAERYSFSSMPVWTCTVMPPTLPGPGPGAAGEFADLIAALDYSNRRSSRIKPGRRYSELHLQMHHRLARQLQATELVDMSVDEMIHTGVTNVFFPTVSAISSACRRTMSAASCRMSAAPTWRPEQFPICAAPG